MDIMNGTVGSLTGNGGLLNGLFVLGFWGMISYSKLHKKMQFSMNTVDVSKTSSVNLILIYVFDSSNRKKSSAHKRAMLLNLNSQFSWEVNWFLECFQHRYISTRVKRHSLKIAYHCYTRIFIYIFRMQIIPNSMCMHWSLNMHWACSSRQQRGIDQYMY